MAPVFSPIRETWRGLAAFTRGWRWLRERPKYLWLLFIPMVLGLVFFVASFSMLLAYQAEVMAWILFPTPEAWYWLILYYLAQLLLYLALLVLTAVASLLAMNVLASPIYEIVSMAVEAELLGRPTPDIGFWGNVKTILVELKKVAFILFVSVVLLLIPGVNILSTLVTAFLVGWDFFDYPVARRGWTLGERWRLVRQEFWAVLGLGLWLVIPFVQILLMPIAVAGGTILNIEALQRRALLQEQPEQDMRLK